MGTSDGYQGDSYTRGADGEFDQTRDLDNKQLLQHQRNLIKEQDADIEQITNVVKGIKYEGEEFKTEITSQNK